MAPAAGATEPGPGPRPRSSYVPGPGPGPGPVSAPGPGPGPENASSPLVVGGDDLDDFAFRPRQGETNARRLSHRGSGNLDDPRGRNTSDNLKGRGRIWDVAGDVSAGGDEVGVGTPEVEALLHVALASGWGRRRWRMRVSADLDLSLEAV